VPAWSADLCLGVRNKPTSRAYSATAAAIRSSTFVYSRRLSCLINQANLSSKGKGNILDTPAKMSATFPFRDINVHASPSYYAFSSPSSPDAPTLVVDRPTGDIRLSDGKITGGHRVSNIPGILGIIHLKLGMIDKQGC
jgi:hypothetical protein